MEKIVDKREWVYQRVGQAMANIGQKLGLDNFDYMELKSRINKSGYYTKAVKDSILHMKDFFDIIEFDFLSSHDLIISNAADALVDNFVNSLKISDVDEKKNDDILKKLQEMYGKIYDVVI